MLPGVHSFVSGAAAPCSGVHSFSRATREVERDPLDLGGDAVQRLAHPQVLAEQLVPAGREQLLDRPRPASSPSALGVLADELAELVVGDLDPRLVGDRLERELARDRAAQPRRAGAPRAAAGSGSRRRGRSPARSRGARASGRGRRGARRARLDERPGRLDVRRLDERVGGGGAELRLDLLLDLLARSAARCRRAARRACRTRSPRARGRRRAAAGSSPSRP